MEELISIVMPVYNTNPQELNKCLGSLEKQTYKNIELIIVDGGSFSDTQSILNNYCVKRDSWRVINATKGVSHQRNVGLSACNGKFVTFVDSDDYCDACFIENLYKAIKATKADIAIPMTHRCVYSKMELISETPYQIKEVDEKITKDNYFKYSRPCELVELRKLYKLSLVRGVRFDERCSYGEDLLFNFELSKKGYKTCFVPEAIYFYRVIYKANSGERRLNTEGWNIVKILSNIIHSREIKGEGALEGLYKEFDHNFILFYYALARQKNLFRLLYMVQFKPNYLRRHHSIHDILFMLFPILIVSHRTRKERKAYSNNKERNRV